METGKISLVNITEAVIAGAYGLMLIWAVLLSGGPLAPVTNYLNILQTKAFLSIIGEPRYYPMITLAIAIQPIVILSFIVKKCFKKSNDPAIDH